MDSLILLGTLTSLKGLQKILILCEKYCEKWDIRLNEKKTKNLVFGKGQTPNHEVKLNGAPIPWVEKWDYLGLKLKSGPSFGCCIREKVSKFYGALNSILRIEGKSDDMVMLNLLEAHCIPILSYGIEVLHVSDSDELRKLRVAYNSVYRNMFGYTKRESVTALQHSINRPTWEELTKKRKESFLLNLSRAPLNSLVRAF